MNCLVTNVDFILDDVDNQFKDGLKPNDIVILTGVKGSLRNLWQELLLNYNFTLLLGGYIHPGESDECMEHTLHDFHEKHLKPFDYNFKFLESSSIKRHYVIMAQKN